MKADKASSYNTSRINDIYIERETQPIIPLAVCFIISEIIKYKLIHLCEHYKAISYMLYTMMRQWCRYITLKQISEYPKWYLNTVI